uniref:Pre-mRNA-splicing factor SLU7 n=1 Tax=Macrostomum lignano TaxID=282301 RepID=A0A1I8JCF6_9PLAT
MYDLERGLNAYKYKWSGTDPEPTISKEKSSEEEATTGLPTEDSSSSCDTGRQEVKKTTARADQINCYRPAPGIPEGQERY